MVRGYTRRFDLPRLTKTLISCAVAFALVAPAPALAWRDPADRISGTPLSAGKVSVGSAPDIAAAAGILMTADGHVLWSRGANKRRPMASTTKMMTALLVLEHGGLGRMATVSSKASRTPYGIGLQPGERMKMRSLLELALVASSNDAAYALGENVSGNMATFVRAMNRRAAQLGLTNTHYTSPHGLDAPGHYSSPKDLATLARIVMQKAEFRRIVRLRQVRVTPSRGPKLALDSTDKLLAVYPGLQGVKTGFTGAAGYCFVGYARRGSVSLYSVIMGTGSDAARFAQTARLLDWGFAHDAAHDLTYRPAGEVKTAADPTKRVPVVYGRGAAAPFFDLGGPIRPEHAKAKVSLPIFKGQRLGSVTLAQGSRVLGSVPIIAAESVASVNETLGTVPVSDYVSLKVVARAGEATKVHSFDPSRPVDRRLVLPSSVAAPVRQGQRLGEIVYSQDGKAIARVPALAAQPIPVPSPIAQIGISLVRSWRHLFGEPMVIPVVEARS